MKPEDHPSDSAELRARAEAAFLKETAQAPERLEALSPEATRALLHELRVGQIELEMQNEELRQAQVELDDSRARYFDLYELAPVGYVTLSEAGRVLQANLTATTLLGVTRTDLVQQPLSRFIHEEDADRYDGLRNQVLTSGEAQSGELRLARSDGTSFWAHLEANVAQDESGAPVLRLTLSNIEEREEYKKELQEKEERLSLATFHNGIGIWDWDLISRQMVWDDSMFALYQIRREDFIGTEEAWRGALHPDDLERRDQEVKDAISGKKPFDSEFRVVWPNGEIHHIKAVAKVFRDEKGNPLRMLGTNWDITAIKRSEAEQRESEERYRLIVNTSEEGIITIDALPRIDFVNPKMATMLHCTVEEMIGRSLEDFMDDEGRSLLANYLKRRQQGISEHHEFKFLRKDGSALWTWISTNPITDASGTYVGALAMVTDITERKRAETALAAEKTRLRTVLDLLPMSIYVKDTQSRFLVVNEGCAQALGAANWEEMIGRTDADYFPAATAATFLEGELRVLAGEPVVNLEEPSVTPDGTRRTELTSKVPLRDGEGNIIGLVGASRDITERKQAEEALRLANQKLRLHFEQSPMAVIEWDLDFRVTRWNPAAGTIFGFSSEEALGRHASFIVPEVVRSHVDEIWQALVEKRGGERSTNENVRKDGSMILCEWYNTPLIDERGACAGVASLVVDITKRLQAEADLQESNEELERRVAERTAKLRALTTELIQVEERERLRIADTLHEGLLQLLAAGRVRLGILKGDLAEGISPADFDELLQCFDESIKVGRTLTHELYPPALQTLGLGAALTWLGEWHHDNYGLNVLVEVDSEIEIEEMELRIMLFRAANELLNNVRKHGQVGEAQVGLRLASGGRVLLAVSDTGVGFDPTGVRAREGSIGGFGLFSLRERVEGLGGVFEVRSAPGRGCCITVTVPRGKDKARGPQATSDTK